MHGMTSEQLDTLANEIVGRPLQLRQASINAALNPTAGIAARNGIGGAAPERVQEMIQECRADVEQQRGWLNETTERIDSAEHKLISNL